MHFNRVLLNTFHTKLSYQVAGVDVSSYVFVARRWSIILKTKPFATQEKAELYIENTEGSNLAAVRLKTAQVT
jgi:hypothetical protein